MAKRGRPSTTSYNAKLVKRANERLRKLEKVHAFKSDSPLSNIKFTDLSAEYRSMERYINNYPNTKGKIYRRTEDGGIRFIGRAEYEKLTQKEKRYYDRILSEFLEKGSTTKIDILVSYQKAYETFKNANSMYSDMSFEEYMLTWKTYNNQVKPDKKNQLDYDKLTMMIDSGQFRLQNLTKNQVEESQKYNVSENNNPFAKKGGKLTYQHRTMADMSDKKPRGY